jgi:hypothetical protein
MAIGTLLVDQGLISREQLVEAMTETASAGERLDRVLIRRGLVTRDQILQTISLPVVDLDTLEVDSAVLAAIPSRLIFRLHCIPIRKEGSSLVVATSDPFDLGRSTSSSCSPAAHRAGARRRGRPAQVHPRALWRGRRHARRMLAAGRSGIAGRRGAVG